MTSDRETMLEILLQIEADLAEIKIDMRESRGCLDRMETTLGSMMDMAASMTRMLDRQNLKLERSLQRWESAELR